MPDPPPPSAIVESPMRWSVCEAAPDINDSKGNAMVKIMAESDWGRAVCDEINSLARGTGP